MLEQESVESADPLIGRILMNRYRIARVLGEGGMGKVYLAEQKMGTATREVAVKTLHPELSGDPQLVARFHRECETVIDLHHPNTVQFYDFGELEDKTLFIVMEFIKGEDLAHVLQRGAIEAPRADRLLIQICGSLHEAHQKGVVHRDLKPENVLLTSRGGQEDFVKVLDFGIAKRSDAEDESRAKLTKQGMVLGTPPYMSPEQFSGQALDARSDIYSLGVMTFEMVAGQLPFEARTPWEWATMHLTMPPKPLEQFPASAQLPDHKKIAIMRALAKDREERQATVLDFMREFTGLGDPQAAWTMATSGVGSVSATPTPQPRQPIGTPQPMQNPSQPGVSQPGVAPAGYATPPGGGPSGSYPNAGYQSGGYGSGGYGTGDFGSPPSGAHALPGSNTGKLIAVVMLLAVLVGVTGGLGIWMYARSNRAASNDTPPTVPSDPVPTDPKPLPTGVASPPSDPTDVQPGDATSMDANPIDDTTTPDAADPADTGMEDGDPGMDETPSMRSTMSTRPTPPRNTGPDADDVARARNLGQQAIAAANAGQLDRAVTLLQQAQRGVGRRHASIADAVRAVGQRGSTEVGVIMLDGNCNAAQALYRKLRSVGADAPSRQHFADWCPRP